MQHVMNTLSKSGAERDLGVDKFPEGYHRIGHDVHPNLVARLTRVQPWAPEWVTTMVDDKPIPYEVVGTGWGGLLKHCYLGENYGIATTESGNARYLAMAQWRREAKQAVNTSDLGTLDMRYTVNVPRWTNDGQGHLDALGDQTTLQDKNRMIVIWRPHTNIKTDTWKNPVTSLQSSLGFFTIQDSPTWQIFVDGQPVTTLPFTCKQGQKITLHDGVTYLGIIPLPATDLGRDAEVEFKEGVPQDMDLHFYGSMMKANLVINSYNYKGTQPLTDPAKQAELAKAFGGFTIEFGDAKEWGDFATFQKHIADATVAVETSADAVPTFSVTYTTGKDVLKASSNNGKLTEHTVNGVDIHPAAGIELDTPYAQQGIGKVAKNGATLTGDAQRRLFLLTEPKVGVYCAWNPLPDLTPWTFQAPGGLTVTSQGSLGLARMVARPKENTLVIDEELTDEQLKDATAAKSLLISGIDTPPAVTLNGKTLDKLAASTGNGQKGWVVPLSQ